MWNKWNLKLPHPFAVYYPIYKPINVEFLWNFEVKFDNIKYFSNKDYVVKAINDMTRVVSVSF